MVDAQLRLALVILGSPLRQQFLRGDVHRHHMVGRKPFRRPREGQKPLIPGQIAGIFQQIRRLPQGVQRLAQGGGTAQGVPVGTDVGEQEEVVPFPQPLGRSLYCHTSSSSSGR